ncbi:MAG: hypothetical protein LUE16_06460 [Lachnospiraceae bacterium]|nr:hypothetical protein [Lachnospiraceae bacterium]
MTGKNPEREWLSIDGRKVLWDEFSAALGKQERKIRREYGDDIYRRYRSMTYPIKYMAELYADEAPLWPNWFVSELLRNDGFPKLENPGLGEAIEEAFDQMVKILDIDLNQLLDDCAVISRTTYQEKLAVREREDKLCELAESLAERMKAGNPQEKVDFLISLQKEKERNPDYDVDEKALMDEWQITALLSQMIACSQYSDTVPFDAVEKANELDLISEEEIVRLLNSHGEEYDEYKYFREDYLPFYFNDLTVIPFREFIEACEPAVEKALRVSLDWNCLLAKD